MMKKDWIYFERIYRLKIMKSCFEKNFRSPLFLSLSLTKNGGVESMLLSGECSALLRSTGIVTHSAAIKFQKIENLG